MDPPEEDDYEDVKSNAVVKYSVPKPAQFTKLKCNTDLNLPPSNWLSNSADSFGLQQVLYQHKGFSRMAHLFPDCVGDVDVVSDSENIKKLLKIPYSKGHISMMVHRVENTLLLDDFNIYKHLLRTAETEWEWLRKFFFENVESTVIDEEKTIYVKNKKIKALQQQCLISKFLYHSLGQNNVSADNDDSSKSQKNEDLVDCDPILPDPSPQQAAPTRSTSSDHKYNRNVVWTFEDISMLIGTDLPIFGGATHPCISLRLREMNQPINVLTGIDYWLDNLMSNVPELVMCYHLNGIVQKYELVKTEDLPSMENSKFSPKLIRDVAQSILSFLKSNATKAGHTYWLFKGKNEEVVKLYDLTSLCTDDASPPSSHSPSSSSNSSSSNTAPSQNPFTVPVAMLLYRVARNMKRVNNTVNSHSSPADNNTGNTANKGSSQSATNNGSYNINKQQPATIRTLLRHCVRLLDGEKYPEIVTSSHYMLSDVYVPADMDPGEPEVCFSGGEEEEEYEDDLDRMGSDDDEEDEPMKVLSLESSYHETLPNHTTRHKTPPPITSSIEERCINAISHIASGIDCLQYIPETDHHSPNTSLNDEDNVQMADTSKPIPMPYAPLKKAASAISDDKLTGRLTENMNALLLKSPGETQAWTGNGNGSQPVSWKDHLKTLLYEKAILVYTTLSEYYFRSAQYGSSLRSLGLLVRCLHVLAKLTNSPRALQGNSMIASRAGDCCIMITKHWPLIAHYKSQLHSTPCMHAQLQRDERQLHVDLATSPLRVVLIADLRTVDQLLGQSVECYRCACGGMEEEDQDQRGELLTRLGNSYNELGTWYLNRGKGEQSSRDVMREACEQAEPWLKKALGVFEQVKDEANIALLCTNLGHLHRMLVHVHTPTAPRGPLVPQERLHFRRAIAHYRQALQVLGERRHNPRIWDAVTWELSSAWFALATILHEHPIDKSAETERELIETFQTVLKYCESGASASTDLVALYEKRSATVFYRLGSLYHKAIYDASYADETRRKHVLQLARVNYEKAGKLFYKSKDIVNYLTLQNQHYALSEYLVESSSSPHIKLKHQQHSLSIILETADILEDLRNGKTSPPLTSEEISTFTHRQLVPMSDSCTSLLILLKQRLQSTLLSLLKLSMTKPPIQKECPQLLKVYKRGYSLSLSLENEGEMLKFLERMQSVLGECRKMIEEG